MRTKKRESDASREAPNDRQSGSDEGIQMEKVDGKWVPKYRGVGDRMIRDENQEAAESEESKIRKLYAWDLMKLADRALMSCILLAKRVKEKGDTGDAYCLINIIGEAIRGLEGSPHARWWMAHAKEWPSFVPGGPETGPLRKAWSKSFAIGQVGKDNAEIPQKGKVDYAAGKPAKFAKLIFDHLDELRRSGPNPLLQQLAAAGAYSEPAYHTAARILPPLASGNLEMWREIAMASLEHTTADWTHWLGWLPDRLQTAKTKTQKKADKGMKYGTGESAGIDLGTAKSLVSAALLEGFRGLLKSTKSVKK